MFYKKNQEPNKPFLQILFFLSIGWSIFLRLRLPALFEFKMDEVFAIWEGQKLFQSWYIDHGMLSGVNLPNAPAFSYIMGLFLHLSSDPFWLNQIFVLLNLAAYTGLAVLVRKKGNYFALSFVFLIGMNPWLLLYSRKMWAQCLIIPMIVPLVFYFVSQKRYYLKAQTWPFLGFYFGIFLQLHQSLWVASFAFGLTVSIYLFYHFDRAKKYFLMVWSNLANHKIIFFGSCVVFLLAFLPYLDFLRHYVLVPKGVTVQNQVSFTKLLRSNFFSFFNLSLPISSWKYYLPADILGEFIFVKISYFFSYWFSNLTLVLFLSGVFFEWKRLRIVKYLFLWVVLYFLILSFLRIKIYTHYWIFLALPIFYFQAQGAVFIFSLLRQGSLKFPNLWGIKLMAIFFIIAYSVNFLLFQNWIARYDLSLGEFGAPYSVQMSWIRQHNPVAPVFSKVSPSSYFLQNNLNVSLSFLAKQKFYARNKAFEVDNIELSSPGSSLKLAIH